MIGRKQEKKTIKEILESQRSDFLAVTGRRRVGKTYLVDRLLREHFCFSMTGIQAGDMNDQLVNFGVRLAEYDKSGVSAPPENWQMAMLRLRQYLKGLDTSRKQVIFIDELPWIATPRSKFLQMLAHLWNDYLSKHSHFILVICGSATSWIKKHVVNDPGGLHNRLTRIIHLQPFTLGETRAFLESKKIRLSDQEITRLYMALGGIPYYLDQVRRGESFASAIERICYAPDGPLKNEYQKLYKALFNHADLHLAIVDVLASHPQGMTHRQIQEKAELEGSGSYHRAVKELIQSNFVEEMQAFGRKKRGAFYRLTDEYSIFYHRFIVPQAKYTPGMWQQIAASQAYKSWTGYAFELLCYKHLGLIKEAMGIAAVYTEISSLYIPPSEAGEGFQIDLLIDRKDDTINLCEVKFHAGPFTIQKAYYQQLIAKRQRFIEFTGTRKQVFLTMITNHGLVQNKYSLEVVDIELLLEDFFPGD